MQGGKEMKTTQSLPSRSCFHRSVILGGKKHRNCESDSHPMLSSIGDNEREAGREPFWLLKIYKLGFTDCDPREAKDKGSLAGFAGRKGGRGNTD